MTFRWQLGINALARASGSFLSAHDLNEDSRWKQVVGSFEPLHFGNFGGLSSKILWAAAGRAPALPCISGMSIWWQRRRKTPAPKQG
jgi:uncharacterized iron-regulated membrane protein